MCFNIKRNLLILSGFKWESHSIQCHPVRVYELNEGQQVEPQDDVTNKKSVYHFVFPIPGFVCPYSWVSVQSRKKGKARARRCLRSSSMGAPSTWDNPTFFKLRAIDPVYVSINITVLAHLLYKPIGFVLNKKKYLLII